MKYQKASHRQGFALTQIALSVALGSVLAAGVVYHFNGINQKSNFVADANVILSNTEKSFDAPLKRTWKFSGKTFNEGQAFDGTATIDTSVTVCAGLKAELASMGSVHCDESGLLTFASSKVKPNFLAGVADDLTVLPSPDPAPIEQPSVVDLNGKSLTIASTIVSNPVNNTPVSGATFTQVATNAGANKTVNGGNSGGVLSETLYAPSIMYKQIIGNAVIFVPPPPPPPTLVLRDLGCTGGWVGQRLWMVDSVTGAPVSLVSNTCAPPASPPPPPVVVDPPVSTCAAGEIYKGSSASFSSPQVKVMAYGAATWSSSTNGTTCGPTSASGSAVISYLGKSTTASISCSGIDPVTKTTTDTCDGSKTFNFNGGTFQMGISGSSRFRQDVAMPGLCPAGVNISLVQVSVAPGC